MDNLEYRCYSITFTIQLLDILYLKYSETIYEEWTEESSSIRGDLLRTETVRIISFWICFVNPTNFI
jgi:hypothetical protein